MSVVPLEKKPPFWWLDDGTPEKSQQRTRLPRMLVQEAEQRYIPLLQMLPPDICSDIFPGSDFGCHSFKRPEPEQYTTFDVRASYVAAMQRSVAAHGLQHSTNVAQVQRGSFWLCETPAWTDERIGHPGGHKADPGKLQWYTARTRRLMERHCGPVKVVRGYAPKTLNFRYPHQTIEFRHTVARIMTERKRFPKAKFPDEYEAIKLTYSKGLMSMLPKVADSGKMFSLSFVLLRPDIVWTIRSESYASLWEKAWTAVSQYGRELVLMSGADEIRFAGNFQSWPMTFGLQSEAIGALQLKEEVYAI